MCEGTRKSTNELRSIGENVFNGTIPVKWNKYKVADINVIKWVNDFVKRVI